MNDLQFSWQNFQQVSPEIQEQLLEGMGLNHLDRMTWKKQAETLDGAPEEVVLRYFGELSWEAQVKVWNDSLPVGARREAYKALKPQAAVKLGLRKKNVVLG